VETLFRELDRDGDGSVTFDEMLRAMFPLATDAEMTTMEGWVMPEEEKPVPVERISSEQIAEMQSIFHVRYICI